MGSFQRAITYLETPPASMIDFGQTWPVPK